MQGQLIQGAVTWEYLWSGLIVSPIYWRTKKKSELTR